MQSIGHFVVSRQATVWGTIYNTFILTVIFSEPVYAPPAGNVKSLSSRLSFLAYFFSCIYLMSIQGFKVIIFHFMGGSRL